jgi:hypothetical protein
MKMTAFWDIEQCILVGVDDVSEARTASIIRAVHRYITEDITFILAALRT